MANKNYGSKNHENSQGLCLYAIDKFGHCTHAKDAVSKESYYCRGCNARVYRTHRNNRYYFACCPGEIHTSPNCHTDGTLYDITLTDPDKFFANLFTPPNPHGPTKGFGPVRGPRERISRCTSLKHIFDSGIIFHPPKNDSFGDYHIGKLILTNAMLADTMTANRALSNRIIYALPEYADYVHHTIRFAVLHNTSKDDMRITETLRFLLEFEDHLQDFQYYRNKLFAANGKPIPQPVLVAAKWHFIPNPECTPYCGKTHCHSTTQQCMGFQLGKYYCRKQLYIPKPDSQSRKTQSQAIKVTI